MITPEQYNQLTPENRIAFDQYIDSLPQRGAGYSSPLTPVDSTPEKPAKGEALKTDLEILLADRAALDSLIKHLIIHNRHLAWLIVDAWLTQHNQRLVDAPTPEEEADLQERVKAYSQLKR